MKDHFNTQPKCKILIGFVKLCLSLFLVKLKYNIFYFNIREQGTVLLFKKCTIYLNNTMLDNVLSHPLDVTLDLPRILYTIEE